MNYLSAYYYLYSTLYWLKTFISINVTYFSFCVIIILAWKIWKNEYNFAIENDARVLTIRARAKCPLNFSNVYSFTHSNPSSFT